MTEGQGGSDSSVTVYPLGKYVVLAEIGRGGMAEVYLALCRGPNGFNKLVVLKLLRTHLAEDEDFLRMFLGEARLAARLNHPNIVQTYEVDEVGGRNCIVMEYLEGRSLADIHTATQQNPMPQGLQLRVIADALAGLHYAHERRDVNGEPLGLIHRDVSPHNVLVTYDGQVKIVDFGIAKAADDGAHTKTGVFKGKLRYTAPERFCGEESDRRSDIFSVGVMLWQVLLRRRLWAGMNELEVMQQLAQRVPIPSPRLLDPQIPALLDQICVKALANSPADRFQTAAEMQDAIEEILATDSVGTTNRALARFMGERFGETRAQFQRTVDEQVRAAASIPFDVELSASSARMRAQRLPLLGSEPGPSSLSRVGLQSSSFRVRDDGPEILASEPVTDSAPAEVFSAPTLPRRLGWTAGVAASILLATVAALWMVLAQSHRTSKPATVSVPEAPMATVPTATDSVALAPSAPTETAPSADSPDPALRHPAAAASFAARHPPPAHLRPVPPPVETHVTPPPPEAEPRRRDVDCASPFFIDDQGMKKIRSECL